MLKIEYVDPPVKKLANEDWALLKVNSYSPYYVSTRGRIFSTSRQRILKGKLESGHRLLDYTVTMDKSPLPGVRKKINAKPSLYKRTSQTFQRLVAITFIPRPTQDHNIVIHLDYDPLNNNVGNLKWMKESEAWQHTHNSPAFKRGSHKKLTEAKVKQIRGMLSRKKRVPIQEIAEKFGVSEMTIFRLKNGDSWKTAGGTIRKKKVLKRVAPDVVNKVRELLATGEKGYLVAKILKLSPVTVSKIKNNIIYKNAKLTPDS